MPRDGHHFGHRSIGCGAPAEDGPRHHRGCGKQCKSRRGSATLPIQPYLATASLLNPRVITRTAPPPAISPTRLPVSKPPAWAAAAAVVPPRALRALSSRPPRPPPTIPRSNCQQCRGVALSAHHRRCCRQPIIQRWDKLLSRRGSPTSAASLKCVARQTHPWTPRRPWRNTSPRSPRAFGWCPRVAANYRPPPRSWRRTSKRSSLSWKVGRGADVDGLGLGSDLTRSPSATRSLASVF
jgi:hypothetical protein